MYVCTYRNSSLAPELSHSSEVIISGTGRHTQDGGVGLTEGKVCVDVSDTPRHILSTNLLHVGELRREREGREREERGEKEREGGESESTNS